MTTTWQDSYDVVAIGSGGGGLLAALEAVWQGGTAVVVEKRELLGGSTAMSGGVVWLPDNPVMQREGVRDSFEDGMRYFRSTVGDGVKGSTEARRRAFLEGGHTMVRSLLDRGIELVHCTGYSDYYDTLPGGLAIGRSIESVPWDGRQMGEWLPKLQPGMAAMIGLSVMTNEIRELQYVNRSRKSFVTAGKVWARTQKAKVTKTPLLTNGAALMGQLIKLAVESGVQIWTESPFDDFVVEDGRVAGVRIVRDGVPVLVEAKRGVVVAAGGFAHNADMRHKYGGIQTTPEDWSVANPGDTGDVIPACMALGAATDQLDEAIWLISPPREMGRNTLQAARQRPGAIMVDAAGNRFCNESNSYIEVGKAMFERNQSSPAVPAWMIFDEGYRKRYAHDKSIPGKLPKAWLESGLLKRADTLADLAKLCDIDPAGLESTVTEWNVHAREGRDPVYHRGESAYNACLGDPGRVKNPAVGPLDRAPYYAFQMFPSDVGTCGGMVTDEHGRVLDETDRPILGLYAAGNGTATVMGRKYLGAGASIANTMVFGYLAAKHAMTAQQPAGAES